MQEINELGCVYTVTKSGSGSYTHAGRCPENSFVTKTTFWLGSAKTMHSIWYVSFPNVGSFQDNYFSLESSPAIGVRPVIVVKTSDILS